MEVILNEKSDFTTTALVEYLTEKYGTKKSGKPFRIGDFQGYFSRGYLPAAYGGYKIEYITNEAIGLKLIRVHFDD